MPPGARLHPASGLSLRLISLLFVLLSLVVFAPLPVSAQPELTVAPSSGRPGTQLVAVVTGLSPGAAATFLWDTAADEVPLGTANGDGEGQATLSFEIPLQATVGAHLVRVCLAAAGCPPGADAATATIDVLPAGLGDQGGLGAWLPLLIIAILTLALGFLTASRLNRTTETFKPTPKKKHDHEFEQPPQVGRPPWSDREP